MHSNHYQRKSLVRLDIVFLQWDLSREGGPSRKPGAKCITRAMLFFTSDLLDEEAFNGLVLHRGYQHDPESFTRCLTYACTCTGKENEGRISTINLHPLSPQFMNTDTCYSSKSKFAAKGRHKEHSLHKITSPLVIRQHSSTGQSSTTISKWNTTSNPQRTGGYFNR